MAAYYNENNKFAASRLRDLIAEGLIATGEVDDRSIVDVKPQELYGYTQCHFFAGIGVWSYALRQAGWPDDRPVWTGSCPCQPFSLAGHRKGFSDSRHLWPEWFRLIAAKAPSTIFGEQTSSKGGLEWFDIVSNDLEEKGYTIGACDTCAAGFGAPHIRQRLYFCASNAYGEGLPQRYEPTKPRATEITSSWGEFERVHATSTWKERETQSPVPVFIDGSTDRVEETKAFGNALCAPQAQAFIEAYCETEQELYLTPARELSTLGSVKEPINEPKYNQHFQTVRVISR